jgi:WXG100 family type VII secretion target
MTDIRINTGEVEGVSARFVKERGDLEALVGEARAQMNALEGGFRGRRAQKIFSEWGEMQPSLRNAVDVLQRAGDLLKRAATSFGQADETV